MVCSQSLMIEWGKNTKTGFGGGSVVWWVNPWPSLEYSMLRVLRE